MPLKDSLKIAPWPGGAPFLSELEGEKMADNTITPTPNTLTPQVLRQVLDRWCEEQPGVVRRKGSHDSSTAWDIYVFDEGSDPLWAPIAETSDGSAETYDYNSLLALTALAIEHSYTPWLKLAASLPYTGAKAAAMALKALEPTKPLITVLGQVGQDLGGRVEIVGGGE